MKYLFTLLLSFGSLSALAESIHCQFTHRPLFGLSINVAGTIPKQGFQSSNYPAQLTVAGPRLYQVSNETLKVSYINTRLDVGLIYKMNLGNDHSIKLVNIWYHPQGKTYFTGESTSPHSKEPLVCKYSANE